MVRVEVDADDAYEKALARRRGTTYSEREEKARKLTDKQQIALENKRIKAEKKRQKEEQDEFNKTLRLAKLRNKIHQNSLKLELSMFGQLRTHGKQMIEGVIGPGGTPPSGYTPGTPKGVGGGKKGKDKSFSGLVGAASILLLVAALHKATAQSKIVGVIESSISKALGLLVDLILLPFLPLITWGIIGLYQAIMEWNKTYQSDPIGTLAKSIDLLSSLFLPVLVGKVLGGIIIEWLKENSSGFFEAMLDLSKLTTDWNNFMADPLGGIKQKFGEFIAFIKDDLIRTQILIQNAIANSSIGKALGWVPENAASSGLSPGYHPPTPVPIGDGGGVGTPSVSIEHIPSGSPGNIPIEVKIQVRVEDGQWIDQKIESKFASMNWDQRAANWGTM